MKCTRHRIDKFLENAATASQNKTLLDDSATRGALLRSLHTLLDEQEPDGDAARDIRGVLARHPDYYL